ncbi:MAG: SufE family protein [Wenzhouxiangellaceae bacterium]|nr:SufE family protein [Wenzhouxiangellaceae bacterium]
MIDKVGEMDIEQTQDEIIEEFSLFDDWLDKYQYIIDLGRKLEPLDAAEMRDDVLLEGCQSQVWLHVEGDAEHLEFRANSDAAIVSGLVYLMLRVYSGHSARDILAAEPRFIRELGLSEHLSATRSNGLNSMLQAIRGHARRALR